MKRKLSLLTALIAAFALVAFGGVPALAQTDITPGGPWVTDTQVEKREALHSYDELVKTLKKIEKSSKGLVELEVIGLTNQGREIYLAKIGDPSNTPVMFQTQQHGGEPMGTEAALKVIQFLSTGSAQAQKILDELYVLIVVRVNPDGAELWQRYNDDPNAPDRRTSRGLYTSGGVGWDINRFHFADWTQSLTYQWYLIDPVTYPYPENPVPEAQAVMDAFLAYQPIWMVDVHGQGTYVTDAGKNVTSSMLWPTNDDVAAEYVELSRQLCVVMMDQMAQYGYATVNQYPGGSYEGIARNAYGLAGAGSVLVEIKGGIGQKSVGMLVKHTAEQMMSILEATADGSLFDADPGRADELDIGRSFYYKDLPRNEEVEPE
jgi:hypothetical protein